MNTFTTITVNNKKYEVMTDYYKENGIRKPLSGKKALEVAKANGWELPTKEIVDAIWRLADLKLSPITMPPSNLMASAENIKKHNDLINAQIGQRTFLLLAGHKKDVIKPARTGRVTIYGWHRSTGIPIQPVSSIHGDYYYDYSHGIRFIKSL